MLSKFIAGTITGLLFATPINANNYSVTADNSAAYGPKTQGYLSSFLPGGHIEVSRSRRGRTRAYFFPHADQSDMRGPMLIVDTGNGLVVYVALYKSFISIDEGDAGIYPVDSQHVVPTRTVPDGSEIVKQIKPTPLK